MSSDDHSLVFLQELQYDAGSASLKRRLLRTIKDLVGVFRAAAATEGFKAGPLTLKNVDLQRVHSIVNEIDTRMAFYTYVEDEIPEYVLASISEARREIRQLMRGVWAESSQERLLQELQHALADFAREVRRLDPVPTSHHDETFEDFEELLGNLRLKVWSLIAYLKIKSGDIIRPKHLPSEILDEVKRADLP